MSDLLPNIIDPEYRILMALGLARAGELAARQAIGGSGCDEYNARAMEAAFDAIQTHLLPIVHYFEEKEKQAEEAGKQEGSR